MALVLLKKLIKTFGEYYEENSWYLSITYLPLLFIIDLTYWLLTISDRVPIVNITSSSLNTGKLTIFGFMPVFKDCSFSNWEYTLNLILVFASIAL